MKNSIKSFFFLILFSNSLISCSDMDLVPRDQPNSASWYKTEDHFRQSLNEGYRADFWPDIMTNGGQQGGWDDDTMMRSTLSEINSGTIDSEFSRGKKDWELMYKGITRMLTVIKNIHDGDNDFQEDKAKQFEGEAKFLLGAYWSYLIFHFGDVPFYEDLISVDESIEIERTEKQVILDKIYEYFDFAAENLPEQYSGQEFATKGAALAFKTRAALYMEDFSAAAVAAESVINLGAYSLHPDYGELFLARTKESPEIIFKLPRDRDLGLTLTTAYARYHIPRNITGYGSAVPTWQLLASFECVDGKPIDESPLFDPHNPFKNRDPRLLETIVPFGSLEDGDGKTSNDGSSFVGYEYNPHPYATKVYNYNSGKYVTNKDTKSNEQYTSYNGLMWKKAIDESWEDWKPDNDDIRMRYADVLLMYAEAKIEMDEIDEKVLAAMNEVRDRAYANSNFSNPKITTTDQKELRYKLRNERRAEFADEGRRYYDIIRWRIADKVLDGRKVYGLASISSNSNPDNIDTNSDLVKNVVEKGNWFWGMTPDLDQNGNADFESFVNAGLAQQLNEMSFPERQYLWPIPADERRLNSNLSQNEGY